MRKGDRHILWILIDKPKSGNDTGHIEFGRENGEMEVQHYFIFNPMAGARSAQPRLQGQLDGLSPVPYTMFITGGIGDAVKLVKEVCRHEMGPLRFYACGGDGTLGEVAQGVLGFPNAAVGVWPCGSGNDFTRIYGGEDRFMDLKRQLEAPTVLVDLIMANGHAAINVVNLGLEAQAASAMLKFRHQALLGGRRAYLIGVLNAVTRHIKTRCRIVADGELFHEGDLLTASFASGQYVGGGFRCAPRAVNDDGLMDLCVILPQSRLTLARLLGIYKKGEHLDSPAFKNRFHYRRASRLAVECARETALCLDGEIIRGKSFALEIIPRAVRFILPEMLPAG